MLGVLVEKVSIDEFSKIATNAHLACFNENRSHDFNRFNYALVCHSNDQGLVCYSTIIEHDQESAYMQHGGTFLKKEQGLVTTKGYLGMINWLKKRYPVITTRIFNDNIAMLKLALTAGFIIIGMEFHMENKEFRGGVLLNLSLESDSFNG